MRLHKASQVVWKHTEQSCLHLLVVEQGTPGQILSRAGLLKEGPRAAPHHDRLRCATFGCPASNLGPVHQTHSGRP